MSNLRHGKSGTPAHNAWLRMRDRCKNDRSPGGDYGRRGVTVCARWDSFENFLEDMGQPPAGTSLDRIDVNGNYEPSNCRWATRKQQARNTRANTMLELRGARRTIAEWSEVTGIKPATICVRLASGLSVEDALTRPVVQRHKSKPWQDAGMSRSAWYRAKKGQR